MGRIEQYTGNIHQLLDTQLILITRRNRPHTPAWVQIRNRRCTVDFEAPKHGGTCRQEQPLTSTYTIAANTASSSIFAVPPP
jgi:hypothetical protein